MKLYLQNNDIEMHSTDNKGKSVLAKRFIRTLKNRIYKYMTSVSKNVYIDKLDDIINKYNNTYHTIIKINLQINWIDKLIKRKGDKWYVK